MRILVCYFPYYFASFLKFSACYQFFQPLAKYELKLLGGHWLLCCRAPKNERCQRAFILLNEGLIIYRKCQCI